MVNRFFSYLKSLFLKRKIVALLLFICCFAYFVSQIGKASVHVKLKTHSDSIFQVFWANAHQRYVEANSSAVRIYKEKTEYTINIADLESIRKLRFDPLRKPSQVIIKSILIKQIGFQSISFDTQKELKQLIPLHHISKIDYLPNGLSIVASGSDPMLQVAVNPAIESVFRTCLRYVASTIIYFGLSLLIIASLIISVDGVQKATRALYQFNKEYQGIRLYALDKQNRLLNNNKLFIIFISILFIVVIVLLGRNIIDEYHDPNIFGTRFAPASDAMMWLRGTVHYMNDLPFKTYRPTINLFFSSILTVFGRIHSIPLFSILLFFINMTLLFLLFNKRIKTWLTILLMILLLFFDQIVDPLNIGQLMMDFPPFVFTIIAIFFIGWALKSKKINFSFLYTGLFILGAAAAVRGIQLVGGVIIVMTAMALIWKKSGKLNILFPPLFFLLPIIIDILLQTKYETKNNGIYCFFCFYADHHHFYTKHCQEIYKSLNISHKEVMFNYFSYLCTAEGFNVLSDYVKYLLSDGLSVLKSKLYITLIILCTVIFTLKNYGFECATRLKYILSSILTKKSVQQPEPSPPFNFFLVKSGVHIILVPALVLIFPQYSAEILLIYLALIFFTTILLELTFTNICLSIYLGGVLLFAMMGMPGRERVASGFAFTLPLACLLYIIEDNTKTREFLAPKRINWILAFNIFVFLFLYTANFMPPLESNFQLERKTLIKLSDDSKRNVSLYYSKEGKLFYTRYDQKRIGFKRPYEMVSCPPGQPCTIE